MLGEEEDKSLPLLTPVNAVCLQMTSDFTLHWFSLLYGQEPFSSSSFFLLTTEEMLSVK